MSAIDERFAQLKQDGRKAFMPFLTAGDPDIETTLQLLGEFETLGCDFCELGVPYSDPIADGPVIQASYTRALNRGFRVDDLFQKLCDSRSRRTGQLIPVGMVSYAIIFRRGLSAFVEQALQAGIAGCIVPDLPGEQAAELAAVCQERDFSLIQLVTPTTPLERAIRITETASGFIYFVSVTGITGERQSAPEQAVEQVARLREHTDLPICLGFGISTPAQIQAIGPQVDGYIVGSAIVRRVANLTDSAAHVSPLTRECLAPVTQFVQSMLAAVRLV